MWRQRLEGREDLALVRLLGLVNDMVLRSRLDKLGLMDVLDLMNVMRLVDKWGRLVWLVDMMNLMNLVLTGIT